MHLQTAIAYSPGNKASILCNDGTMLLVEQRYDQMKTTWYHVWHDQRRGKMTEYDFTKPEEIVRFFDLSSFLDMWQTIN